MTMQLTAQEQLKFSHIMFQSQGRQHQQIQSLTTEQKAKLKSYYAQKIAYDTANANMKPLKAEPAQLQKSSISGATSTICCCFLPQQNRESFDITSEVFIKRVFSTLLFFKSDFLSINNGKPQLYGFMWLSISYVVILGLAANLNEYFILSTNYEFSNSLLVKALGICAIFLISQPFVYAAVIKCLGGYISSIQSMMLTGYSIVLYFIPTILCLIPSLYWHVGMLALAGLIRTLFLFRNYSPKITQKSYAILIVISLIQVLFVFVLMRVLFDNDNGYGISAGTKKIFSHHALRQFYV